MRDQSGKPGAAEPESIGITIPFALIVLVLVLAVAIGLSFAALEWLPETASAAKRNGFLALCGVVVGALGPVLELAGQATQKDSPGRSITASSLTLAGATITAVCGAFAILAL